MNENVALVWNLSLYLLGQLNQWQLVVLAYIPVKIRQIKVEIKCIKDLNFDFSYEKKWLSKSDST